MQKAMIRVQGMSCGHCTASVTAALQGCDGVETVLVSLEDGTAAVTYQEEVVTLQQLKECIEELGFDVVD